MSEMKTKTVCVQGLGFVGSAMSVAIANAKNKQGECLFKVYGIDLPNQAGLDRINALNKGIFPFETTDQDLIQATSNLKKDGNFEATSDETVFQKADIVVVDINLDVYYDDNKKPYLNLSAFKNAINTLGKNIRQDTLVIIETTVPPGTCEKVVKPILEENFKSRGLVPERIKIAHSYERVMPGDYYYNSIINYWRVFSGINKVSRKECQDFLSSIINVKEYPLTELASTTASETAKVLENSYRAVNIAFMEEWGRYAEKVGVNMFEIVNAIRKRPTHSNMRQPGFGVGGYCLTKDPFFAKLASKDLFGFNGLDFPFCTQAVELNNKMPLVSLNKIKEIFGGTLKGKRILLLGVSYKQDVGDTRYSPSEIFAREAIKEGVELTCFDPLIKYWAEMNMRLPEKIPAFKEYDAVVLTVRSAVFETKQFTTDLAKTDILVFDTNNVLNEAQIAVLKNGKCRLSFIGRGDV